jgi:hypothetical protein
MLAGLRVLVVDDDPLCLKITEQMLKRCNYEGALPGHTVVGPNSSIALRYVCFPYHALLAKAAALCSAPSSLLWHAKHLQLRMFEAGAIRA